MKFIGLVDVYRKTLQFDGVAGLYCRFNNSCVCIIMFRGLYFGNVGFIEAKVDLVGKVF